MDSRQEKTYQTTDALLSEPPNYNQATAPPQQNMPQPQTVHIIQQVPTVQPPLGPKPCRVTCPSCHQVQVSRTNYVSNSKTHLIAVILCVTTCCCCIPYCFDTCRSAEHTCSKCGAYLGRYDN